MTALAVGCAREARSGRWLPAALLVLGCLAAVAQNGVEAVLPDGYGAALREEVLEAARDDWRRSQDVEQGWRAPARPERSRMEFGYDAAYDELHRGGAAREDGAGLSDPRPNTLFRLGF